MIIWVQRIENLALAAFIALAFIVAGFSWWWLFALFLAFDLSALGYIKNARVGAWWYNAVHNYTIPAVLGLGYGASVLWESPVDFLGLLAGCWAFHVAVDRGLGYGLKLITSFSDTHLGTIGKQP